MNIHTIPLAGLASAIAMLVSPQTPPIEPLFAPRLREVPTIEQIIQKVASPRIQAILTDLAECESTNDPNATNPIDLDGTPSHGLLQFKPSTLYLFAKEFKVLPEIEPAEIYNVLYDPEIQVAVAEKMIEKYGHQRSFWQQQWPACSARYNYWENIK